jgi:hypothetical protein
MHCCRCIKHGRCRRRSGPSEGLPARLLWSNLSICLLVAPCACAGRCSLQTTVSRSGESRVKFEKKGLFGNRLDSRNRVGRVEVQFVSAGRRVMMISSLFMLPRPLHTDQSITLPSTSR